MFLLPSVLKSQNVDHEDHNGDNIKFKKTYQMQILNVDKKLGFVSMASMDAMQSIVGWFNLAPNVHTRAELRKDNDDKETSKNYDPSNEVDQEHVANVVQNIIKRHAIVVFSKTYCPFCKKTQTIFLEQSVRPHVVELDLRGDGEYIQDVLLKTTGRRTVSQVFIYGIFVGGCNDLVDMKESGKLHELLKQMPPPDYYKPQK
jgi:glutaredoxin 3